MKRGEIRTNKKRRKEVVRLCWCGQAAYANGRCWNHLQTGLRTILQLGTKIEREPAVVPAAFHKAFSKEITKETALDVVSLPSPITIWLQQIANIEFKLEYDQLSPEKRRNLEHELSVLRRKLDQN